MSYFYAKNPEKYEAMKRRQIIKSVQTKGTVPRKSSIEKYGITPEELATPLKPLWVPKNPENPEKHEAMKRRQIIKNAQRKGTVPRKSSIEKYGITPEELATPLKPLRRPNGSGLSVRKQILKRAGKTGRKPRDKTMKKYKITQEELISSLGNSWCKTTYEKPEPVDQELKRLRLQVRELKGLLF